MLKKNLLPQGRNLQIHQKLEATIPLLNEQSFDEDDNDVGADCN